MPQYTSTSQVPVPASIDPFDPIPQFKTMGDGLDRYSWVVSVADQSARIALEAPVRRAGLLVSQRSDNTYWGWDGAGWFVVGGKVTIGSLGADGNATINYSKLTRTAQGFVSLVGQSTRTGGGTYASALIVGILPVGFRPPITVQGSAATYGSGTRNSVTVNPVSGVITLMEPSPAGHTVAEFNLHFQL